MRNGECKRLENTDSLAVFRASKPGTIEGVLMISRFDYNVK